MSFAGSHDSGAYEVKHVPAYLKAWARCQCLSIFEQLESGIRFLDLRMRPVENPEKYCNTKWWVAHRFLCVPFQTVLDHIQTFLRLPEAKEEILVIVMVGDWPIGLDAEKLNELHRMVKETLGIDILLNVDDLQQPLATLILCGKRVCILTEDSSLPGKI